MNDEAVYRTAPATPGLLNIVLVILKVDTFGKIIQGKVKITGNC